MSKSKVRGRKRFSGAISEKTPQAVKFKRHYSESEEVNCGNINAGDECFQSSL